MTAPVLHIFLLNSFFAFEAKLLTNPGNLSLTKGMSRSSSVFFPKLSKQEPKDLPDLFVLGISALLTFKSLDMLLEKIFLILVIFVLVRNNSWGSSLLPKFLLFILNIASVLLVAVDSD